MCDKEIMEDLLTNIVCFGGNTMFSGFHERLMKEMCAIGPKPSQKIMVC